MNADDLAINGGPKACSDPVPGRRLFGQKELDAVTSVFKNAWKRDRDFGSQEEFEKMYTDDFCALQGGGFADAVSSGTAGIYLALAAMDLDAGSEIIVSPVTDPGGVTPVIALGFRPVIADSSPDSFNTGPEEFKKAITTKTRAAIITHVGGIPADIKPIMDIALSRGIKIIEDCSQAHGAFYQGKRIGTFGDIAVFSTMFSKNHASGGCGGLVFTKNEEYYWRIRSLADRGKSFKIPNSDFKNPKEFLMPALNFGLDEISCAIGRSTLSKLDDTNDRRLKFAMKLSDRLRESSVIIHRPYGSDVKPALFFYTAVVAANRLNVSKEEFADAISAEGVWLNGNYGYVVSEWQWMRPFVKKSTKTPNAVKYRGETFNILFHERFGDKELDDIVRAILKVESVFKK